MEKGKDTGMRQVAPRKIVQAFSRGACSAYCCGKSVRIYDSTATYSFTSCPQSVTVLIAYWA